MSETNDPFQLAIGDGTPRVLSGVTAPAPSQRIQIAALSPGDSPRLAGERIEHVRALANAQADLPPILVHRPSMRVIDGMHRLRAAQMRGDKTIACQFFDCDDDLTFVAAVVANIAHGLPLSLVDREAAASRIIAQHATWSDRTVASITGLAPSTVGSIRRREDGGEPVAGAVRRGRDGRLRPLSTAEGRRIASEIIATRPGLSLRAIARAAGISTGTVRDVRQRVARGEDPVPIRRLPRGRAGARKAQRAASATEPSATVPDRASLLEKLRNDPSLRFTQAGRDLLRWLDARTLGPEGWERMLSGLPPHSAYLVADLACWCSQRWLDLAGALRERPTSPAPDAGGRATDRSGQSHAG